MEKKAYMKHLDLYWEDMIQHACAYAERTSMESTLIKGIVQLAMPVKLATLHHSFLNAQYLKQLYKFFSIPNHTFQLSLSQQLSSVQMQSNM